jgi:hypothetical protein
VSPDGVCHVTDADRVQVLVLATGSYENTRRLALGTSNTNCKIWSDFWIAKFLTRSVGQQFFSITGKHSLNLGPMLWSLFSDFWGEIFLKLILCYIFCINSCILSPICQFSPVLGENVFNNNIGPWSPWFRLCTVPRVYNSGTWLAFSTKICKKAISLHFVRHQTKEKMHWTWLSNQRNYTGPFVLEEFLFRWL